jgi:hypothetical protein
MEFGKTAEMNAGKVICGVCGVCGVLRVSLPWSSKKTVKTENNFSKDSGR